MRTWARDPHGTKFLAFTLMKHLFKALDKKSHKCVWTKESSPLAFFLLSEIYFVGYSNSKNCHPSHFLVTSRIIRWHLCLPTYWTRSPACTTYNTNGMPSRSIHGIISVLPCWIPIPRSPHFKFLRSTTQSFPNVRHTRQSPKNTYESILQHFLLRTKEVRSCRSISAEDPRTQPQGHIGPLHELSMCCRSRLRRGGRIWNILILMGACMEVFYLCTCWGFVLCRLVQVGYR